MISNGPIFSKRPNKVDNMTFFHAGLSTDEKNLLTVFPKSLAHHSRVFHSSKYSESKDSVPFNW